MSTCAGRKLKRTRPDGNKDVMAAARGVAQVKSVATPPQRLPPRRKIPCGVACGRHSRSPAGSFVAISGDAVELGERQGVGVPVRRRRAER